MSSSYPVISCTCTCTITKPSGLVRFLPNPMRFIRWSTRSFSSRTGNPYCCTKVGVIIFTWLPLSTKALTFLPSMVKSTSVSGLIQCEMGPPASSSGCWIHPITRMFMSGHVFVNLGMGWLFSPTPLDFNFSWCHRLKALQCGQSLAKWPGDPHTKPFRSSLW